MTITIIFIFVLNPIGYYCCEGCRNTLSEAVKCFCGQTEHKNLSSCMRERCPSHTFAGFTSFSLLRVALYYSYLSLSLPVQLSYVVLCKRKQTRAYSASTTASLDLFPSCVLLFSAPNRDLRQLWHWSINRLRRKSRYTNQLWPRFLKNDI